MAALLVLAVFGGRGTAFDPFAARGALLAVFCAVQLRRFQYQAVRRPTVTVAAFGGAMAAAAAVRAVTGGIDSFSLDDGAEILAASAISTGLMALSFHYLTLRRGFMV